MSDQVEELIREIASKHGIAVARNDPILILQTINNRLLQDGIAAQEAMLSTFKSEIEGVSLRWNLDAKEKADRILNSALSAARETMQQTLQEGAAAAAAAVKREAEGAKMSLRSAARGSRGVAILNILASAATLIAAAMLLSFR